MCRLNLCRLQKLRRPVHIMKYRISEYVWTVIGGAGALFDDYHINLQ